MSQVKISGDPSGTGILTIATPNTNSNFTLTLPTNTGTLISTKSAGTVLQVVCNTYATAVSSTTSTFVDTGLTATITPTSATSKILVSVSQNGIQKVTNTGAYMRVAVLRNATIIGTPAVTAGYTASGATNYIGSVSGDYLDSPATTSAIVYKTQFKSEGNAATVSVQGDSEQSTITLMEIAA